VVFDPSDPDANRRAAAGGFTVVTGSMLPKETWQLVKDAGLLPPVGHLFPTHFESLLKVLPEKDWTGGMKWVTSYVRILGRELLKKEMTVKIVDEPKQHIRACFGGDEITFNVGLLGDSWFEHGATDEVNRLIIHEFGHAVESDHLSSRYYEALCKLGAKLARLALERPEIFQRR
jgi:hypothetical protein